MKSRTVALRLTTLLFAAAWLSIAQAEPTAKLTVPAASADEVCHPAIRPCRAVERGTREVEPVGKFRGAESVTDAYSSPYHVALAPIPSRNR